MSLYEVLGIDPLSNKEEIRKAYRKKIKDNHPDIGGDPEKFKNIKRAYLILYDDQSRANYDNSGKEETPDERKPLELDKLAETFALKVVFSIVDSVGENICFKNIKILVLNNFKDIEEELRKRLTNIKSTWKAIRKKHKALVTKLKTLKSNNNFLYKALKTKSKHIEIQEILPIKEECRKTLEDLKICLAAKKLIEDSYDDYIEKPVSIEESWSLWDKSFKPDQYNPYNLNTTSTTDYFKGEDLW